MVKANFGLPESLINSVREIMEGKVCPKCGHNPCQCDGDPKKMEEEALDEKLIGNQKKLDKNHNGKLDKQDFKMLRKEEVEELDERDAGNKAKKDAAVTAVGAKNKDSQYLDKMNPAVADKIRGREKMSGVDRKQYKEEVEEIDELSRKTLNSYAYKADKQLTTVNAVGPSHKAGIPGHYRGKNKELGKDPADKMRGRKAGINMAVKKLNKEEVEELDELSPATMKSYQSKAVDSIGHAAQNARSMGSDKDHLKKPLGNEIRKRKKGLDLSNERLAKKDIDEEVEFSEAEIARIEEIAKGL
jgi:hypothetical protein